jgi:hypothetical protein
VRYLKLGFTAALLALATIALLRVTDVLPAEDLGWVLRRTIGGIAVLTLAAVGLSFFSRAHAPAAPDDKPVP